MPGSRADTPSAASIPASALLPAPSNKPPAASGPLAGSGRHPAPRPASHAAPFPPVPSPAARQGADLGACPRRASPRRGPALPAASSPSQGGSRRNEAAGPLLTGLRDPGGGKRRKRCCPLSLCSPPAPLPSPGSPLRTRAAEPPSGAGRAEGKEVGPSASQATPGTKGAVRADRPGPPAPPSPGVALAEGGFQQRRDVRALSLQIRRASLRHLLPPAAAAAAAGAGAGHAACWE